MIILILIQGILETYLEPSQTSTLWWFLAVKYFCKIAPPGFLKRHSTFYDTYLTLPDWADSNLLASKIGGGVTTGSYWGCRLRFYPWKVLPRRTDSVPPANDWTSANFSRIWWSLGIAARWMWLMQQMNPTPKINGLYHKILGRWTINQPTAGINQFSQQTTATTCSTGDHSWYQLSKDQRPFYDNDFNYDISMIFTPFVQKVTFWTFDGLRKKTLWKLKILQKLLFLKVFFT